MSAPSTTITIRVPASLKAKIARAAKSDNRTITSFVRHAIDAVLAKKPTP